MSLTLAVVRILAQDDDLYLIKRGEGKGVKELIELGINSCLCPSTANEPQELEHLGGGEVGEKKGFPVHGGSVT